jgi:hypothetical protein
MRYTVRCCDLRYTADILVIRARTILGSTAVLWKIAAVETCVSSANHPVASPFYSLPARRTSRRSVVKEPRAWLIQNITGQAC